MREKREQEVRKRAREQIIGAIEDDLSQGESLMKEAFEDCRNKAELKVTYDEMKRVIKAIEAMP